MDPITIVSALAQFAPQLVKYVTGNDHAEEVAKTAMDVAMQVTGTATGSQALSALNAKPELAIQYQTAVMEREAELEKAHIADVDSARNREVKIATSPDAPLLNKIITPILALTVTIGCGTMLYFSEQPDVRTAASNLMMLVLGYYFGTSVGSHKQADTIANIVKKS